VADNSKMKGSEIKLLSSIAADCAKMRTEISNLKHSQEYLISLLKSIIEIVSPGPGEKKMD
jgi:hypothetical protein